MPLITFRRPNLEHISAVIIREEIDLPSPNLSQYCTREEVGRI